MVQNTPFCDQKIREKKIRLKSEKSNVQNIEKTEILFTKQTKIDVSW